MSLNYKILENNKMSPKNYDIVLTGDGKQSTSIHDWIKPWDNNRVFPLLFHIPCDLPQATQPGHCIFTAPEKGWHSTAQIIKDFILRFQISKAKDLAKAKSLEYMIYELVSIAQDIK